MPIEPGTKLGRYEVVAPIGAGGMGEVYRAHDTKLDRDVAIKVLPEALASDSDLLRRFHQEGRAVGALNHPNIMAIYDADIDGPTPYVVCELLEGKTLRSLIADGSITPRKAIEYTKQTATGLAAAHDKGITHRDLKPDNLFVTEDGRVKILDFGLAKVRPLTSDASPDSAMATREMGAVIAASRTEAGTILGTIGYMAPEQVRGQSADPRSDIFSLGTILYEMLTGRRAFRGDSSVETMNAILKEDPPELTSEEVAPGVELVLRHCLEKSPGERFQSARDLAFHLDSVSTASGLKAVLPEPGWIARRQPWPILVALALAAVAGVVVATSLDQNVPAAPSFQQLTFRQGAIPAARFAPDGETIVYSAAWDGRPVAAFLTRPEDPESRSLELDNADLLDVSTSGEIALLLDPQGNRMFGQQGTLARASLSGSATREVLEDVVDAAWMPSSDELVIVRFDGLRSRLELPAGTILHEAPGTFANPRVSPAGDKIALIHHPVLGDDGGSIAVVDLEGNVNSLTEVWSSTQGLAWTPGGEEIWFGAARSGANRAIHAVTLSGRHRVVYSAPASLRLHDISKDGRVLVTRDVQRQEMIALAPGEPRERNVSWLDWSLPIGLSGDGKTLLFNEAGEGGGTEYSVYMRSTDGQSPAIRLGDGFGVGMSPDGSWAVVVSRGDRSAMRLLPTGAGEPVNINTEFKTVARALAFPDRDIVLVVGITDEYGPGVYEQPIEGGPPRPLTAPATFLSGSAAGPPRLAIDANGETIIARGSEVPWMIYPLDGGNPRPIEAMTSTDIPLYWSKDHRYVYTADGFTLPMDIWRVDLETARRQLWRRVQPVQSAGTGLRGNILLVAEAEAYVAAYSRVLSELHLVDGLY